MTLQPQKNYGSLIEVAVSKLIGVVLSYLIITFVLAPALRLPLSSTQSVTILAVLHSVSVLKNYFVRRFFENRYHLKLFSRRRKDI